MKYTLLLLLALPAAAFAQTNQSLAYSTPSQSYSINTVSPIVQGLSVKGNYRVVTPPGYRMRNAGRVLTMIGGALLVTGVVLISTSDDTYYQYNNYNGQVDESGDPKFALGILSTIGGVGMIVPGVTLWTKGGHRYHRYMEQQGDKPAARIQFKNRGLALTYHF